MVKWFKDRFIGFLTYGFLWTGLSVMIGFTLRSWFAALLIFIGIILAMEQDHRFRKEYDEEYDARVQ